MEQKLEFGVWVDGTTIGGHPVLAILAFLIWRPEYSSLTESKWINALRFCPVCLAVLPENQTNIANMVTLVREQALQLNPLTYKGVTYKFDFRVLSGDHSAQQKILGNAGGSAYFRCENCNANFSDFQLLWQYDKLRKCCSKSLQNVVDQWLTGTANENGLTSVSPLLGKDVAALKNLDGSTKKWLRKFQLAIDSLHNCKGHLATIVKRLQSRKEFGWDEQAFTEALEKHVQRRKVGELDGAHYRLLFSEWRRVFLPALHKCDPAKLEKLKVLFHHWEEIQWTMNLSPEARNNESFRLRLHGLTLQHLQLCRDLFPDVIKRGNNQSAKRLQWATLSTLDAAQIRTLDVATLTIKELKLLIHKVYAVKDIPRAPNQSKNITVFKYAHRYGRIWSVLTKADLGTMLMDLCQLPDLPSDHLANSPSSPTTQPSINDAAQHQPKRKTIMNLYLHTIVTHLADFYQSMDFKNSSTERGEAFLASMKHIFLRFTSRDFTKAQTMREVLIRHCWQAKIVPTLRSTGDSHTTYSRISRSFDRHVFQELEFDTTDPVRKREVFALLNHLENDFGYQNGKHWLIQNNVVKFNTLSETAATYRTFHKERSAPSQPPSTST